FQRVTADGFASDVVADYYLDGMPAGYAGLYRVLGQWDPRSVSKVLPYALTALTVGAAVRAGRRPRVPPGGGAAAGGGLGAGVCMDRAAGGRARSFAFRVLALMLLALAGGRPVVGALATVLGALFCPAAGVVCGLALGGWLLLFRGTARGR